MITKIYKILTYILILPAAFLSFLVLFSLLLAFVNPGALFITFVFASVVIYTATSFNFLQKVIMQQKQVNAKLKDWIKVNAFVTLIFIVIMVTNIITAFAKPIALKQTISTLFEQQKNNPNFQGSEALMYNMMMGIFVLFGIYCILLAIHIICGFKLLKQYQPSFKDEV